MNQLTCPPIREISIADIKESRPVILFTSPSAYEASFAQIEKWNLKETIFINTSKQEEIDEISNSLHPSDDIVFYAIGAGQVCDMARYIASAHDRPLYCIPSALTSDAFLVNSSGIRQNGCVTYVPTCYASEIFIDWNLIEKSGDMNVAGCGDILSIHSALIDWENAEKKGHAKSDEPYDQSIANIASSILEKMIANAPAIRRRDRAGLRTILLCLVLEVNLCNFYGNSRPEEGGEHYFAYCIENKIPHFMHGKMLAFSIMLTSFLQGGDWKRIKSFLDTVGLNYASEGLSRETILQTLQELPAYCEMHGLRYSIYSDLNLPAIKPQLDVMLKEIGVS